MATALTIRLSGLACPSCASKIESAIKHLDGVQEAKVLFTASKLKVKFEEDVLDGTKIEKTVRNLGYDTIPNRN